MKTIGFRWFTRGALAAALVALATFIPAPANAAHEMIYAVDQHNNLFNFWSDDPSTILSGYAISGVQNAEEIRGLDYWGGTLYGLGSFSRLYTIDPGSGAATQVGGVFSPLLNGLTFGADNDPNGYRVVSALGQNLLLVNRTTGTVTVGPALNYVLGDVYFGQAPRVDALAYDYSTGSWLASDTSKNSVAAFNPATGGLSTLAPQMGIDASRFNGMDISPFSGIMYMGTPAASSDPQANLYTLDKMTGWATLVGQIGGAGDDILVRGLTVVPEPGSIVLVALGVLGLFLARRRE